MGSEELTWIEGQAKESVTRAVTFNSFSITWEGKGNMNSESHPWLTRRETGGRSSCLVSIHIVLRAGYCWNVDTVKSLEWERQVGLIHLEVHCLSTISLLLSTDFLTLTLRGPFLCSSLWQNSKRVKHTNQVCCVPPYYNSPYQSHQWPHLVGPWDFKLHLHRMWYSVFL